MSVQVGVGCFVTCHFDDGVKILIGKRKGSHGSGTWQLAGGHLEVNETFEACARREVLEETNLAVDQLEFLTATNDIMSDGKHYVTIFMKASVNQEGARALRTMEPEKVDGDWQWVSYDDIAKHTPLFLPLQNFLAVAQSRQLIDKLCT